MRPLILLREAWVSTRTRLVPALMVALLCASMCGTTLLTVGRTASAEAGVMTRLEQAGSLDLTIIDLSGSGLLSPTIVESVASLSTVDRAVGLTVALDARSGTLPTGGTLVPAWGVVGDMTAVATIISGRAPQPGEAMVSESSLPKLGHDGPTGFVIRSGEEYPIVGIFIAREPFTDLNSGIVIATLPGTAAHALHVIATSSDNVEVVQKVTLSVVSPPTPEDIAVQSAVALAALQGGIAADLHLFSRQLVLLVLGGGAILTLVVVLTDVLLRRADLGRRRALGATQQGLITLVLLRTLIAALTGIILGTTVALIVLITSDIIVPPSFVLGTIILTLLAALTASIAPATIAATRDPASVLRTP